MSRIIILAICIAIILFLALIYLKYGKPMYSENFISGPVNSLGNVPTVQNSSSIPNSMPGSTISDITKPTLSDLENTLSRVDFEKRSLVNTRSSSENIKSRIATLDKMQADISEYISKIKRQKMKLSDVPFTKQDLDSFLLNKTEPSGNMTKPSMTEPSGKITETSGKMTEPSAKITDVQPMNKNQRSDNNVSNGLEDLHWKVQVEYDPSTSILRKLNNQMEMINQEIQNGEISQSEIDTKNLELKIIEQQIIAYNKRRFTNIEKPAQPYTKDLTEDSEPVSETNTSKPFFMEHDQTPLYSKPNEQNRPTYSQDYSKRASSASYDNESVNSVDYRKKADFLCNQIKNAELGEPSDFGCIKNPETDVGPDYSWRGNYKMVCNRLGRVWGGWYPEMFGCPPVIGTDEQAPVVFEADTVKYKS